MILFWLDGGCLLLGIFLLEIPDFHGCQALEHKWVLVLLMSPFYSPSPCGLLTSVFQVCRTPASASLG